MQRTDTHPVPGLLEVEVEMGGVRQGLDCVERSIQAWGAPVWKLMLGQALIRLVSYKGVRFDDL